MGKTPNKTNVVHNTSNKTENDVRFNYESTRLHTRAEAVFLTFLLSIIDYVFLFSPLFLCYVFLTAACAPRERREGLDIIWDGKMSSCFIKTN